MRNSKVWAVSGIFKTSQVVLISFMGAAFSIMAFNNDVGVTKMFSQIYELVTGTKVLDLQCWNLRTVSELPLEF